LTNLQFQLQQAAQYLQRGESRACQDTCSRILHQQPSLLAAFNLRGLALAQEHRYPDAIQDLSRVWPEQARNYQAALWLGRCYRLVGEYALALEPLQATALEVTLEAEARYELAQCLTRLRQTAQAMEQYQTLLRLQPQHANAAANLAFLQERSNRLDEAEAMAKQALQADANSFLARLTLGTLQRRNGLHELAQEQFERCLQLPLSAMNRSITLNQMGQCLLAQHEHAEAFRHFEQANTLLLEQHPHAEPAHDGSYGLGTIARLGAWLSRNPPAGWTRPAHDPDSPSLVFVVGFPRSGTTLVDQALSAHPQIEVLEEFELLDQVRRDWVDGDGLEKLPGMNPQQLGLARQQYLQQLAARRKTPEKACVVDKLPLNLVYLFLLHRLFPEARILFMLRDPRDACLSCFFQSFDLQGAMPYFLDLRQTAVYYDAVMGLARQSLAMISNPVMQLCYESLVADFEPSIRAVLQFLGLPWSEEIHQYRQKAMQKVIDTPSYQQVTRPLYQESIGRWRHFSLQMEPVQTLLGPWVQYFGYPPD
jgi:tetratricopeptide (TPR) repeat protein